jgi:hypothetical protein
LKFTAARPAAVAQHVRLRNSRLDELMMMSP